MREHLSGAVEILAQGALEFGTRARRAAETEIDAPREQRRQRAELLGDLEWSVVGQHDPARADPDGRGGVADMREHDRGRTPGDPGHGVVFGDPEARAPRRLRDAREIDRGSEGFLQGSALAHRHEIEDREICHCGGVPPLDNCAR